MKRSIERILTTHVGSLPRPPSLSELLAAFERHLAARRGLSPHTVRAYAGDISLMFGHAARCGVDDAADLDISLIRAWLATQYAAGHSRATIARRAAAAADRVTDAGHGGRGGGRSLRGSAAVAGPRHT